MEPFQTDPCVVAVQVVVFLLQLILFSASPWAVLSFLWATPSWGSWIQAFEWRLQTVGIKGERERERDPSSSFPSFIPAAQRCGFSRFYISKSKDHEEEREGGHSYALETSSRTARRKHPWKDLLQMGSCREVATFRVHSPALCSLAF